jgi:hypothetical protein
MLEALESRLVDGETVAYELTSAGGLVHEHDGERRERGGSDGGTLLAATDRKLVFVLDTRSGRETADVDYTDVKDVTVDSGILTTKLSVTVWGRGRFTMTADGGDDAATVAEFVGDAATTWRLVVAALQDARQHVSTIEKQARRGDMEAFDEARAAAIDNVERAADRTTAGERAAQEPLATRIEAVRDELRETEARARAIRGEDLVERASALTDAAEYDAAYDALQQAREQYDRALTIAIEDGLDAARGMQAALSDLKATEAALERRPLDVAERARQRAQAATDPERGVTAWEEARERYRDALEAGWGSEGEFAGDSAALRMQIEWVVTKAIDARRRLARRLEDDGDKRLALGKSRAARDRYEAAADQIAMARRLARQHRAGDEDLLSDRCERLRAKYRDTL